ncbi:cysteine methyltransferase, partial [Burkholderia multivorans]
VGGATPRPGGLLGVVGGGGGHGGWYSGQQVLAF